MRISTVIPYHWGYKFFVDKSSGQHGFEPVASIKKWPGSVHCIGVVV